MKLQMQEDQIQKQIEIDAPVARVWRALTDHTEFGQWFGVAIDGPFVAGEKSRGRMTIPGHEQVKWDVDVQELDPQRHLFAYTWHPYAIDPDHDYSQEPTTRVEFQLEAKGDGTLLTVTETGFSKLPANRMPEALRMNTRGWEIQAQDIKEHVEQNA